MIEDKSRQVHFACFDSSDGVVYFNSNNGPGTKPGLLKIHDMLMEGQDPIADDWSGNAKNPEKAYQDATSVESTYWVVCNQDGMFPLRMAEAAKRAFSVGADGEAHDFDATVKDLETIEQLLSILCLADNPVFSETDMGVYMTTKHYAVVRDFSPNTLMPFAGKPRDVVRFLRNIMHMNNRPDNLIKDDWIYNRIHEAMLASTSTI